MNKTQHSDWLPDRNAFCTGSTGKLVYFVLALGLSALVISPGSAQIPTDELGISLDIPAFEEEFQASFEVGLRAGAPAVEYWESALLSAVTSMYQSDIDAAIQFIESEIASEEQRRRQSRRRGFGDEMDYIYSANIEFALGQLNQLKGNHLFAERYYLQAIEKYPSYVDAYVRLMSMYMVDQDCEKAIAAGHKAIEIGGTNGYVFKGFGICHFENEEFDAAFNAFRVARIFLPDDEATAYSLVLSALETGNTREAIAILDELIEKNPEDRRFYLLQANAYLQGENYDGALLTLDIARRQGFLTSSNYGLLGDIFIGKDMPEAAYAVFSEALTLSERSSFGAVIEQFDRLTALEDWDSAAQYLQEIQDYFDNELSNSNQIELEIRNARVLLATGQRDDAGEALRRVVDADPGNGQALLSLAQFYRAEQDFERAGIYYERAAESEVVALTALTEYAQLAADREDWQLGINLLTRASEIAPEEAVPAIEGNIRALLRIVEFLAE